MKTILLTGGTGLIGTELTKQLIDKGYKVHILTRNPNENTPTGVRHFHWDVKEKTINADCFETVSEVIHLAGASVAQRWTENNKQAMIDSRVETAKFLRKAIKINKVKLNHFIGASASGYYKPNTGTVLTEASPKGSNFLSTVCEKWEDATLKMNKVSKKVAIVRIGFVLAKNGGALEKILPPFSAFTAPYFDTGNQYYPCVHISDVAKQFIYILEEGLQGAYNASSEIITQWELNKAIAKVKGIQVLPIPTPKFALQLALGDMHQMLTDSIQMSGEKIRSEGFQPEFPTVEDALRDIIDNTE